MMPSKRWNAGEPNTSALANPRDDVPRRRLTPLDLPVLDPTGLGSMPRARHAWPLRSALDLRSALKSMLVVWLIRLVAGKPRIRCWTPET
jgi:hypothetical protein